MEWVFIVGVVVGGPIVLLIMAKGLGGFLNSVQGIGSNTDRTENQGLLNSLPPNERRHIAKLARSEANIEDPELGRKAAAACRATLATFEGLQRTKWWLLLIASVFVVARSFRLLSGDTDILSWIGLGISGVVMISFFVVLPRSIARQKQQVSETARINGWSI